MNHDPTDSAVQSVISNMSVVLLEALAKLKQKEEIMKGRSALAECGDAVYQYLIPIKQEITASTSYSDERLTTFFTRWASAKGPSQSERLV